MYSNNTSKLSPVPPQLYRNPDPFLGNSSNTLMKSNNRNHHNSNNADAKLSPELSVENFNSTPPTDPSLFNHSPALPETGRDSRGNPAAFSPYINESGIEIINGLTETKKRCEMGPPPKLYTRESARSNSPVLTDSLTPGEDAMQLAMRSSQLPCHPIDSPDTTTSDCLTESRETLRLATSLEYAMSSSDFGATPTLSYDQHNMNKQLSVKSEAISSLLAENIYTSRINDQLSTTMTSSNISPKRKNVKSLPPPPHLSGSLEQNSRAQIMSQCSYEETSNPTASKQNEDKKRQMNDINYQQQIVAYQQPPPLVQSIKEEPEAQKRVIVPAGIYFYLNNHN